MLPNDKARVGSFAKIYRIQIDPEDFTSDRSKLIHILRTELQEDSPTPLWNAVDRGIDKLLVEQGRRVILAFTDGVRHAVELQRPQQVAQGRDEARRRTRHHGLRDRARGTERHARAWRRRGENRPRPRRDEPGRVRRLGRPRARASLRGQLQPRRTNPDEGLPKIAAATGGGYFELTSPHDLATTFARVANELHQQYTH